MENSILVFSPFLVSVIIPAYNAETFIERTLRSVLAQTYQRLEVLVVDDGSSDNTVSLVCMIAKQDHRVHIIQQANLGVAAARNRAIQESKGDLIAPIDADDVWYPTNLEKQVQRLIDNPSLGLVYSWSVEIDELDQLCGGFHASHYHGYVYIPMLNQNFIGNASAVIIRRECLEKVGTYNCKLKAQNAQGSEDLDLHLRITEHYQVGVVSEFLVGYRQVVGSMSRNCEIMARSQALVLEAAQNSHPEIPSIIYQWSISRFAIYLAHQSCQGKNDQQTLYWLFQAFRRDPTMTLIRYDAYLILGKVYLRKLFPSTYLLESLSPKSKGSNHRTTLDRVKRMVKLRRFLPFEIYERVRIHFIAWRVGGLSDPKLNGFEARI